MATPNLHTHTLAEITDYVDPSDAAMDDLTDVTITSIGNLEILQYQSGTALWENKTLSEAGIQAQDNGLDDIAGLAVTNGNFIVGDGANWVAESGATARASMGVSIGTQVQGYDAGLQAISSLPVTNGNFIVGNGSSWVAESGSTARASMGVSIGSDVQAWSSALDSVSNSTYTGDNNITTLGTISTGTWQGSTISATYGGTGYTSLDNLRTGYFNSYYAELAGNESITGLWTWTSNGIRLNDNIELYFGTSTSQSYIVSDATNTYWYFNSDSDLYIRDANSSNNRFLFDTSVGDLHADADIVAFSTSV